MKLLYHCLLYVIIFSLIVGLASFPIVRANGTLPDYQLSIYIVGSGDTDPAPGSYVFDEGAEVSVTANADPGWIFDLWLLNGSSAGSENPLNVTMNSNYNLTAIFAVISVVQYELVISTVGEGTTDPSSGNYLYDEGEVVSVTALPSPDWVLSYWLLNDSDVGSENPFNVTMNSDLSLVAVFVEASAVVQFELVVSIIGNGTTSPLPGSYVYDEGTVVSVTAVADSGWMLDHWLLNGSDVGSASPFEVTMIGNYSLAAVFVEAVISEFDLLIQVVGNGTTDPTLGIYTFAEGTEVDVMAFPDSGWVLDHWLLNGSDVGSANPYNITMDANYNLTVVFSREACDLLGDVNCDCIVDIFDILQWGAALGSVPSDPNWDPAVDLVVDDLIDILDAIVISLNYGATC